MILLIILMELWGIDMKNKTKVGVKNIFIRIGICLFVLLIPCMLFLYGFQAKRYSKLRLEIKTLEQKQEMLIEEKKIKSEKHIKVLRFLSKNLNPSKNRSFFAEVSSVSALKFSRKPKTLRWSGMSSKPFSRPKNLSVLMLICWPKMLVVVKIEREFKSFVISSIPEF